MLARQALYQFSHSVSSVADLKLSLKRLRLKEAH
jgi:hypothetical protein